MVVNASKRPFNLATEQLRKAPSSTDCDVENQENLETFRRKRADWISWLSGDDVHAIWPQIHQIVWDDVLFRTVWKFRSEASAHARDDVGFNADVLRLLEVGFLTTQVTAIRRLTDPPERKDPKKNVLSLRRILEDIKLNHSAITREVYVACDGLPYECKIAERAFHNQHSAKPTSLWLPTTGPDAWGSSELAHSTFDRLADRNAESERTRGDLISMKWFEHLERKLSECDRVRTFVNKFIAHAADPISRSGLTDADTLISLDHLRECHRALYQTASFITTRVLWEGAGGALPVPQYHHLENLDKPWLSAIDISSARAFWEEQHAITETWENDIGW